MPATSSSPSTWRRIWNSTGHWKRNLHDLGECEVKHGVRVSVVNLYTEDVGNPEVPQKFLQARHKAAAVPVAAEKARGSRSWIVAAAAFILIAGLGIGGFLLSRHSVPAGSNRQTVRSETEVAETGRAPSALPTPAAVPTKEHRRSALRKSERRKTERLLHRWRAGRDFDGSSENR